ncbi:MAG: hypothetical protein DI551_02825 [Micavibrio aeruginosavorus]|uniref:Uncharacterized protein n=1 Tax=Micavibrio aeruginosavorus TaxID=349221 RepID=A0A2W5PYY9_9BACT|nr:MAG: hypothetical protein DI551_02825 [Micavibrio aeruginosavorus]
MRAGLFFFLFAFFLPVVAHAQTRACTEMGCENGISFTVDPAQEWKNGQYEISLALDYKKVICRGELPLNACEDGPTFYCDDKDVTIIESGCALPKDQHAIGGIKINEEPNKVIVRVARNYRTMVTRTIVPQYQTLIPNGAGCGPVCRSASYDLFSAN